MSENTVEFDLSWILCFFAGLIVCEIGLIVASSRSDIMMMPFAAVGVLFFSARLVYEAAEFERVEQRSQEKKSEGREEISKWECLDFAIFLRTIFGMIILDVAAILLRASSWCLEWTSLTPMELHTAYYRASYDKKYGAGSVDMILAFYETYIRPDIETDEYGIEWVRT